MIIDFHTHIFPEKIAGKTIESLENLSGIKASTNGTLEGLLASMERTGVDMSVIMPVATKPSQMESINAYAKEICDMYPGKLISFGGIHPDCENYKSELNHIKELGLKGIKIHPDYQRVMIDDMRFMNIIEYASELGLVILTHAGIDIGLPEPVHCPPQKMRKVIDKIKPEKMIVAHYGGWKQWQEVYEYLAGENVYLDTAFTFDYIEKEMFLKILQKHGEDKILFATDSPWSHATRDIQAVNNMPIADSIKQKIFSENAKKLLQIK
ncbi:MAG: amidohydrolase family protein [Lachnospiraceae bacterium]|nr:amidohydrolase family protein [Lachnospiraceae bacterium]